MRRRAFIALLGAAIASGQSAALAQARRRPRLLGLFYDTNEKASEPSRNALTAGLAELGYLPGRDYAAAVRFGGGLSEGFPPVLKELLALKPEVLVVGSGSSAIAARRLTSTVPVVCTALNDPVTQGLAQSFARPAGNVTGVVYSVDTVAAKQVQLGTELLPGATSFGLLVKPTSVSGDAFPAQQAEIAATAASGLRAVTASVRDRDGLLAAFEKLAAEHVDFAMVISSSLFFGERPEIARLAASARIPTIYPFREFAIDGGLVSYGIDLSENSRRAASFVVRILEGANPGDLPIEIPTRFQLVIHQGAARSLGLTIPPTLLARADEVIE
jgi:putative ABC transport system substrate-binding protein